jgi:hypothetical protein
MGKPSSKDRAVNVCAAIFIALVVGLIATVVLSLAAALYGPAWAAIAAEHGRMVASLQIGALSGAGVGVWMGVSFFQHHRNCTEDGCTVYPDDGDD